MNRKYADALQEERFAERRTGVWIIVGEAVAFVAIMAAWVLACTL